MAHTIGSAVSVTHGDNRGRKSIPMKTHLLGVNCTTKVVMLRVSDGEPDSRQKTPSYEMSREAI